MRLPLALLTAVLIACGSGTTSASTTTIAAADALPQLEDLTVSHPCGFGFWLGSADQTAALRLEFRPSDDENAPFPPADPVDLPDDEWSGSLVIGRDLYANWCDDVIEEGEPQPVTARSFPITAGTIRWVEAPAALFDGGTATIAASGLEITTAAGDVVELGDVTITNNSFGFFAG